MNLESRLDKLSTILIKYSELFSQEDINVLTGHGINHPWLSQVLKFSDDELLKFDAHREYTLLDDPEWLNLIEELNQLCSFPKSEYNEETSLKPHGNQKKQHELKRLHSMLSPYKGKAITDFGGGVGKLAGFLEDELKMNVTVLEKDQGLLEKGQLLNKKHQRNINFIRAEITNDHMAPSDSLFNREMAIGLHTCGSFANSMIDSCLQNKVPLFFNFGCCYSKLNDGNYNLSKASNKKLKLNHRALSCATLGFDKVDSSIYKYRQKILDYKFSLYYWLFLKDPESFSFISMSNSRRSLYDLSFPQFFKKTLEKHLQYTPQISSVDIQQFYEASKTRKIVNYINAYYAIYRYFGKAIEAYLLLDRAQYINENGREAQIIEVFDSKISPRNKAIIAR